MGLLAQLIEITSDSEATDLASRVLNPQRRVPLVVVSLPGDVTTSSGVVDLDELRAAAGIRADVAVVGTQHVDVFNRALPMGLAVFGDAVRVYPSSSSWASKPPHCEVVAAGRDLGYGLWRVRDVIDALNPPRRRPTAPAASGTSSSTAGEGSSAGSWRPDATPATTVQRVSTPEQVDALTALLLSPARVSPVVVVTIPAGRGTPWIDSGAVVRELAGLAWVFEVASGRLTFRLNDAIGTVQGVYGGAGRVYSPDLGWVSDPYRSVLRTVYDQRQGDRVTDALIADALGMTAAGPRSTSTAGSGEHVTGTVGMLVPPTRALVSLDDGRSAAVWGDSIPGASDIARVVHPGQRVEGLLDPASGRLDVHAHLNDVSALTTVTTVGDVILSRVKDVHRDELLVTVWPGTDVTLSAGQVTGNPLDDLRDLATPGEVLPARVLALPGTAEDDAVSATGTSGWVLSLLDVDPDDEPTTAPPPLLPDGPPWLTPTPLPEPLEVEPAPGPPRHLPAPAPPTMRTIASPAPAPSPAPPVEPVTMRVPAQVADLQAEVDALRATMRSQQEEIARLRAAGDRLRTTNRRARTTRAPAPPVQEVHGFADAEEQLRWEVYRAWVEQTRPEDKASRPLPAVWHIGPRFLESLSLPGVTRDKVLSVVVHVLTGNAPRETHRLRKALSGNAPQTQREDGALAWRTPIQQNTPSARRLHWWRREDRTIELSRVVLHDDYQP